MISIIEKNINDLKPYGNNPRINDEAVEKVAESIKEFGWKVPVVVDKNDVIVAGHTRLKAAQQLGIETVPVIVADDLTPEQVKAFRLADNKTAEFANWDMDMAAEQLERQAYVMEYDPKYADAIIARWEEFTGEKAKLLKK